jgi:hypothetical protein
LLVETVAGNRPQHTTPKTSFPTLPFNSAHYVSTPRMLSFHDRKSARVLIGLVRPSERIVEVWTYWSRMSLSLIWSVIQKRRILKALEALPHPGPRVSL